MLAKSDEEQASLFRSQEPARVRVEDACIKFAAPEVGFCTLQLRSVDEGQTYSYKCSDYVVC
jgi:DNA-directed RNA polymerase subunit M/transcription elongation factor TFIIS